MNNKICELDAIPTYLIKDILPAVLKTITQIVNMSLATSTFPLDWKTTIIRSLMEEQHITMMVILDLSVAFDMVDHGILLKILENQFGVTDTALRWFNNYLRPRSFKECT